MNEDNDKKETAPEAVPETALDTAVTETQEQAVPQATFARYGKWAVFAVCAVGIPVVGMFMYTASQRAKVRRAAELVGAARNVVQLQKVLDQYPDAPAAAHAKLAMAKAYFDQSNYAGALKIYQSFEQEYPEHYFVLAARLGIHTCGEALGTTLYRQGQSMAAREKLEAARNGYRSFVDANPDHFLVAQAIFGEASCHQQLGRLQDARILYEDFITTSTNSPWVQLAERQLAAVERDIERTERGEPARETVITPLRIPAESAWQLPETFGP